MNKELKERLDKMEQEMKALRADIEKSDKKVWKPKCSNIYYFVDSTCNVLDDIWTDDNYDNFRYDTENCFKTREEAEHRAELLETERQLMKFARENNDEIDWKDTKQAKWYLLFDIKDEIIHIGKTYSIKYARTIDFTSEELAQQAIQEIGEDRIKSYIKEL